MKNTTLAMVAVLAVVTMLSAVLAVPMQQASASDSESGDNKVKIEQSNKCEEVAGSCVNDLMGTINQNSGERGFTPPGQED